MKATPKQREKIMRAVLSVAPRSQVSNFQALEIADYILARSADMKAALWNAEHPYTIRGEVAW